MSSEDVILIITNNWFFLKTETVEQISIIV